MRRHVCMRGYVCSCSICTCRHTYIHACPYAVHAHMYIHTCMYVHARAMSLCSCMYVHAHTCIHACMGSPSMRRRKTLALFSVPASLFCVPVRSRLWNSSAFLVSGTSDSVFHKPWNPGRWREDPVEDGGTARRLTTGRRRPRRSRHEAMWGLGFSRAERLGFLRKDAGENKESDARLNGMNWRSRVLSGEDQEENASALCDSGFCRLWPHRSILGGSYRKMLSNPAILRFSKTPPYSCVKIDAKELVSPLSLVKQRRVIWLCKDLCFQRLWRDKDLQLTEWRKIDVEST
jgi:hypothetical protein